MPPHADYYGPYRVAVNSDPACGVYAGRRGDGVGLVVNHLDPGFREHFRQILWEHARGCITAVTWAETP